MGVVFFGFRPLFIPDAQEKVEQAFIVAYALMLSGAALGLPSRRAVRSPRLIALLKRAPGLTGRRPVMAKKGGLHARGMDPGPGEHHVDGDRRFGGGSERLWGTLKEAFASSAVM